MKEDFVTYEIAKKLKEKGFKGKCLYNYRNNGCLMPNYVHPINGEFVSDGAYGCCNDLFTDYTCDAPTIYQVLKWIREEKKLFVDITLCAAGYYGYVYSTVFPKDKDFSDGWIFEGKYDTYELAAPAGIKYVLDI